MTRSTPPFALDSDPDEVLRLLESDPELLDPGDLDSLRLVSKVFGTQLPACVVARFEEALDRGGLPRAYALQKLGARAWYEGDVDAAEKRWRTVVAEGLERKDVFWAIAVNNLALIETTRGHWFRTLVLSGYVQRHLPHLVGEPDVGIVPIFCLTQRARAPPRSMS